MKLTHPTVYAFVIGGVVYRPSNGVFDISGADASIAIDDFGFKVVPEAQSGAKRAKAGGSPGAKAKPRSRKPKTKAKAKPQGEEMNGGMNLVVTSSYSLTPTFSFSGPGFGGLVHPVQGHDTSYKMESVAASGFTSDIYRIGDGTRYYGEVIRPVPSSAPSDTAARYEFPTEPSPGAYFPSSGSPPGRLVGLVPDGGALASYKLGVSLTVVARRLAPPRSPPRPPPRFARLLRWAGRHREMASISGRMIGGWLRGRRYRREQGFVQCHALNPH